MRRVADANDACYEEAATLIKSAKSLNMQMMGLLETEGQFI